MSGIAIAVAFVAALSISLSIVTLAEVHRIARRLDELEPGSVEISGDTPALDMQFHHHVALGNAEALFWYQNSRRRPPTDDPKAPVNV